jgi:hypothetical protein
MPNMRDGLTHLAAVSIFTLSSIAVAQTAAPIDTSGFDPVVIGWPALTDAGIDILITDQVDAIKLAQQAIAQINKGTELNPRSSNADAVIANYQRDIENHEQILNRLALQRLQVARSTAAKGNVEDLPQLRSVIGSLLGVSRYDALAGNEDEALQLLQATVALQTDFATGFLATCRSQTFDRDIAFGIERQNQMLGNGIDVMHCAYRYAEAKTVSGLITWRICGAIDGKLKVKMKGDMVGEGSGVIGPDGEGEYTAHYTTQSGYKADITDNGALRYVCQSSECACLKNPVRKECAGVDTSKAEWGLIAKEGKSLTGTLYMPILRVHSPVVWKNVSVADPSLHHSLLWGGYPVKAIKVDKPCDPDNIEIP